MRKIIPTLTLLAVLLPFHCFAFRNEPDSFRGIKFGTTIDSLPLMTKIRTSQHFSVYRRKGDRMKLFEIKLEDIRYMFLAKKLFGVSCVFRGLPNFNYIKERLIQIHGEGLDRSRISKYAKDYIWYGETVPIRIMLVYVKSEDAGTLSYVYKTVKTLTAKPSTIELSQEEYADPKGYFKIRPPAGWQIQDYPQDPRGKVAFNASHVVQLRVLAHGVDFETYEGLLKWAEKKEKDVGIDTNIKKVSFLDRPAIKRSFIIRNMRCLEIDFILGNVKHNLQYTGTPDNYSMYSDVAMKSLNSYKPFLRYLSTNEIQLHDIAQAVRLAQIAYLKGNFTSALEIVEQGLEIQPGNPDLLQLKRQIKSQMKGQP